MTYTSRPMYLQIYFKISVISISAITRCCTFYRFAKFDFAGLSDSDGSKMETVYGFSAHFHPEKCIKVRIVDFPQISY